MSNKPIALFIILFIAMLSMNFYCVKDQQGTPLDNTFLIPVNIYPLKKTYSLSDTIWLTTVVTGKNFFDTIKHQNVLVDSGQINFGSAYNEFGTSITSPPNGFCDIITTNGVNTSSSVYDFGASMQIQDFGCGQTNFTCKIGFKPNEKGTFSLSLFDYFPLGSCSNKVVPYNAVIYYKFENVDLNLDIFNSLSQNDRGGRNSAKPILPKSVTESFLFSKLSNACNIHNFLLS